MFGVDICCLYLLFAVNIYYLHFSIYRHPAQALFCLSQEGATRNLASHRAPNRTAQESRPSLRLFYREEFMGCSRRRPALWDRCPFLDRSSTLEGLGTPSWSSLSLIGQYPGMHELHGEQNCTQASKLPKLGGAKPKAYWRHNSRQAGGTCAYVERSLVPCEEPCAGCGRMRKRQLAARACAGTYAAHPRFSSVSCPPQAPVIGDWRSAAGGAKRPNSTSALLAQACSAILHGCVFYSTTRHGQSHAFSRRPRLRKAQ
ncbi:hypothetical protein BDY21DRAFT_329819 [Lineolata rhizophorae]|uniref:Uncharacterized protein n=1 Tax=Lineolata rhizophorae TaxID=578093 RepID=A0A6A6PD00_9PEZI|nr:hypothetical protein BDY21DRAFT_329819 [Lineolata rhizophorae]